MTRIVKSSLMLLIALIFLTSCAENGGIFKGSRVPTSGQILLADDFSRNRYRWGVVDRAGGDIEIAYGGMVFSIELPNFMFWSVIGKSFQDSLIEVDSMLVQGSVNNSLGMICRYQDEANFYGFMISHDGYYGIFKFVDGDLVITSEGGSLGYSEAITQDGGLNHIQAICQGDRLSLLVNGTLLAAVNDDSFTEGKVGLLAGSYDEPGIILLFDNFKVIQP